MITATLSSVADLTAFVHERLCTHDDLDPRYIPLYKSPLLKKGKQCGLFFHIQGPRLVKSYAVWSAEEGRVLFYDGQGNRFDEVQVSEGPNFSGMS